MVQYKLSIALPTEKKSGSVPLGDAQSSALVGKRIGQAVKGDDIGLEGYEFVITGGSDYCGFPIRKGLIGTRRKKILITKSVGYRGKLRRLKKTKPMRNKLGIRRRKSVVPDNVNETTSQINLKVTKTGPSPIVFVKAEKKK